MTEDTDIHALAGAYALDAVDDLERAAFARHLQHCVACAIEVTELSETAARLAGAVAEAPPPRMRETVLAAAARTPQERSGWTGRGPHSDAAAGKPGAGSDRWRRFVTAAVAAGVVGVGAGFATWSISDQRVRDAQTEAAQSRRIADVLAAPDAVVRTKEMGGGRVTLVVSRSQDRAVAVLAGLRRPGEEKLYQLWLEPAGTTTMKSVGTLTAGRGDARVVIDRVGDADAFGLSVEPAPDGSKTPTPTAIVDTVLLT
jgi:anti-sigma factor RsiW